MKEGLDGSSVCLNPSTATASLFFFFNDPAPPEISPLPPHDALPIPTIERPSPSSASSSTTSVRRTDAPFTRYCPSPPRCSRRAIASVEKSSPPTPSAGSTRSEEHTSELQSRSDLVCRLLLEKKKPPFLITCLFSLNRVASLPLIHERILVLILLLHFLSLMLGSVLVLMLALLVWLTSDLRIKTSLIKCNWTIRKRLPRCKMRLKKRLLFFFK